MKNLTKAVLLLAQLGLVGAVQAASVTLSTTTPSVTTGSSVSFDVNVDFTDTPTLGGWFTLNYDTSLLNLTSFTYNPAFTSGLTTIAYDTSTDGSVRNIGFAGSLSEYSGTLGTVVFSTTGLGAADLSTVADSGFYNGSSYVNVTYGGASVQVSAVPVPAALWLMASGLGALGVGLRRRRA